MLSLVLAICVLFSGCGQEAGPEAVAVNYVKACFTGDGELMVRLLPPVYQQMAEYRNMSDSAIASEYSAYMTEYVEKFRSLDRNWSYKYNIIRMNDSSEESIASYEEYWSEHTGTTVDITAAKDIEINAFVILNGLTYRVDTRGFRIIQIGDRWYCDDDNLPADLSWAADDLG